MSDSDDYYPYYSNYGEDGDSNDGGGCGCYGGGFFWLLVILGIIELLGKLCN